MYTLSRLPGRLDVLWLWRFPRTCRHVAGKSSWVLVQLHGMLLWTNLQLK